MKKKIIISVAALAIIAAVFVVVVVINSHTKSESTLKSSSEILSAGQVEKDDTIAGFKMDYSDRLGGYQATDVKTTNNAIEVTYGNAGFVRKTYGSDESDSSDDKTTYTESNEYQIDGLTVTFKGSDGLVYLAVWQANGYSYTISVNSGVSAEDMTEYVMLTR